MSRNHFEAAEVSENSLNIYRTVCTFSGIAGEDFEIWHLRPRPRAVVVEVRAESVIFAASTIPTNASLLEPRSPAKDSFQLFNNAMCYLSEGQDTYNNNKRTALMSRITKSVNSLNID